MLNFTPPPPVGEKRRIVIFGTGAICKRIVADTQNGQHPFEIVALTDNNPRLQGGMLYGKEVIHPAKIPLYEYDTVVVAANDMRIVQQLLQLGISIEAIDVSVYYDYSTEFTARLKALQNVAELLHKNGTQGAVAELGVFQGDFAQHINRLFPDKSLYLFDTFAGFSNTDVSIEKELGHTEVLENLHDFSKTSIDLVMKKMIQPKKCIVKPGFFPETASGLEDVFAFVSLDADLYQPMLAGLRYFYPRLARGGFMFVHDYFASLYTADVQKAIAEYKNTVELVFSPLGDNCSIAIIKR
jgi:O-methyltransferase